jgi:hypothetical protein
MPLWKRKEIQEVPRRRGLTAGLIPEGNNYYNSISNGVFAAPQNEKAGIERVFLANTGH